MPLHHAGISSQIPQQQGWTAGADATLVLATIGATGSVDTNTIRQPAVGFVLTNVVLDAGVTVQGAKINEISFSK